MGVKDEQEFAEIYLKMSFERYITTTSSPFY